MLIFGQSHNGTILQSGATKKHVSLSPNNFTLSDPHLLLDSKYSQHLAKLTTFLSREFRKQLNLQERKTLAYDVVKVLKIVAE